MKQQIIRCALCTKIVALESGVTKEVIKSVNGISVPEIKHSIGGWGSAQSLMYGFTGEVCIECYNAIKIKVDELKKVIEEKRNSRDEGICIYDKSENTTAGYNVPDVQEDELQPKRRKGIVLRLLSRVPHKK